MANDSGAHDALVFPHRPRARAAISLEGTCACLVCARHGWLASSRLGVAPCGLRSTIHAASSRSCRSDPADGAFVAMRAWAVPPERPGAARHAPSAAASYATPGVTA